MTRYDPLWPVMTSYDLLWIVMTIYDFVTVGYNLFWLLMTFYDSKNLIMAFCHQLWLVLDIDELSLWTISTKSYFYLYNLYKAQLYIMYQNLSLRKKPRMCMMCSTICGQYIRIQWVPLNCNAVNCNFLLITR